MHPSWKEPSSDHQYQSIMDIPEHGFSWHGDQGGDISFLHRIFAGQFVVETSTLSIPLRLIYVQSNYRQYGRTGMWVHFGEFRGTSSCDFLDSERGKFLLELFKLFCQVCL